MQLAFHPSSEGQCLARSSPVTVLGPFELLPTHHLLLPPHKIPPWSAAGSGRTAATAQNHLPTECGLGPSSPSNIMNSEFGETLLNSNVKSFSSQSRLGRCSEAILVVTRRHLLARKFAMNSSPLTRIHKQAVDSHESSRCSIDAASGSRVGEITSDPMPGKNQMPTDSLA